MSILEQLQPADQEYVTIYKPFYPPKEKREVLPKALGLYQQGFLEGRRNIEGSDSIAFVASWYPSKLPLDSTLCRLQFDGQADLSYEVTIINHEFIDYLIGVIINFEESGLTDFPQGFYRKLLRFDVNEN
ncbi:MAG: type IV pilus biogenesis protein EbsA [Xenococcaceae cyanobacterium]